MISELQDFLLNALESGQIWIFAGLGIGIFLAVYGLSGATAGPTEQSRRMAAAASKRNPTADFDLVRGEGSDLDGLLKPFVPKDQSERNSITLRLRQAGIKGENALRNYFLIRTVLAVGLPLAFVGLISLPNDILARLRIDSYVHDLNWSRSLFLVTLLTLAGFYLPALWVRDRVTERKLKIWQDLPNALDLLQISVEAGLGFDAAMVRVSHELAKVSPEIAEEFMMMELEIQAGKERQRAFLDMAQRTGVDEVAAFASTILQASEFGTSVSKALTTYAATMREDRELKAQEKANRLPVQMSGVLAMFMMPVLLMITTGPILIRWLKGF